jgi:lipopolysaccharide/colanic/teichoic acid biosynthesis glycosyltransferase
VTVRLRVHDPGGDDPGGDDPGGDDDSGEAFGEPLVPIHHGSRRGRVAEPASRWSGVAESRVQVSSEDPLVPSPRVKMSFKRGLDIVGAAVGLLFTGPIILAAMAAIKRGDGGPPLYRQTREGRCGRPFTIYKLRTMVIDAERGQDALRDQNHRDGPAFKIAHDPRVTPVGRFLRKSCIDELPQLWNVLKGDMSLVGPRPLPWHESRACDHWHRRRLDIRPGMTCDWQVNKAHIETFDEWMRLDLRYIDEMGLVRDFWLILKTFTVPVTGRGSE